MISTLYFIRILTSLSYNGYNLSFYPQSKPNHRTQFTIALRDVKEAFRRGQLIVLGPIEATPDHVSRWIPATTNKSLLSSVPAITHRSQNFRILSQHNRSNNLQYYLIYIPTG